MSDLVFCNYETCKFNVDEVCQKTTIMLETTKKENERVLICKSFESTYDLRRPVNTQPYICPECGYKMIPEGGCSV